MALVSLRALEAQAQTSGARSGMLTVSAIIDGISYMRLSPDGISWEHSQWAAPGLHTPLRSPTAVALSGPAEIAIDWCPVWANGCNTCDGTCGELRDQAMGSLPLRLPVFPGPVLGVAFECRSRGVCRLVQEPRADNGYTARIEMNDGPLPGYDRYEATLRYAYDPNGLLDGGATVPVVDASGPVLPTDASVMIDATTPDGTPSAPTAPDVPGLGGGRDAGTTGGQALAARNGCACATAPGVPSSLGEASLLAMLFVSFARRRPRPR
jgi:MYXO-CTERM domain-containing protein